MADPPCRQLVWLTSMPDGPSRFCSNHDRGRISTGIRTTVDFTKTNMAKELVQNHTDIDFTQCPGNSAYGIALIEPAFTYDVLSSMDDTQTQQRDYYYGVYPASVDQMYFFTVLSFHAFDEPLGLADWACTRERSFFTTVDQVNFAALCNALPEQARPKWIVDFPGPLPSTLLRLPLQMAVLIAHCRWKSFCICQLTARGKWFRKTAFRQVHVVQRQFSIQGFVFSEPRCIVQPGALAEMPTMMNHKFCESLAKSFRRLISHTELSADDLGDVCLYLNSLQIFTDEMREHSLSNKYGFQRGQGYAIQYLLESFFLSQLLTDSKHLGSVLQKSLRLVLPAKVADKMGSYISSTAVIPSQSTISRMRARVDTTWMFVWRDRFQEWLGDGLVVYLGTDSSPQAGRDYQIIMLDIIQKIAMPSMHVDITWLHRRPWVFTYDRMQIDRSTHFKPA